MAVEMDIGLSRSQRRASFDMAKGPNGRTRHWESGTHLDQVVEAVEAAVVFARGAVGILADSCMSFPPLSLDVILMCPNLSVN